jgi:hypothetical protein
MCRQFVAMNQLISGEYLTINQKEWLSKLMDELSVESDWMVFTRADNERSKCITNLILNYVSFT